MLESPERTHEDIQPPEVKPTLALVAICSGILIIGLNTTALNTAIGSIAEDFDMGSSAVAWSINGYLLAAAAFVAPIFVCT